VIKNFIKYLINFWPVILIFAVWFIFSSPYFLKQKVPFPSSYLVNFFAPWSAYPGFASPVKNNAMPDVISQIYPWKNLTIDFIKNFQIPLWNPYAFSGTPQLANYQSAVLSPFNLLFFILPFINAWSLLVLLQPLLAGLFTYLFLKTLKISKEGSVIGAVAFMFCGFITTWMAYATLGFAILFLPLALFAIEKYFQTKNLKFLILFSFSIPLSFFSGHFQISAYFIIFTVFYIVYKYLSTKDLRISLDIFAFLAIGIFLSLPQLLPSIESYLQSLRSGVFEKIEAIPWGYLPTFVAPDFLGNPVTRNDWFGHYAEWNAYIGLLPLMLSFYAVFRKRTKEILFFILFAVSAFLFSFQTPFLDFLVYLKIPVLSTSAASRMIVLFSFSMCVLAGFGFDKLLQDIKEAKKKQIFYWVLSFFVIFVLLWLIVLLKLFLPLDKIVIAKQNLILPTIIFLLFSAVILFSAFSKKIFKNNKFYFIFSIILILITSFDMLRFSIKWMPFDPKNLVYPNTPIVSEFSKISGYERVVSNLGEEATNYYKLSSLEGYDAVYIKRYGEFMASLSNSNLQESGRSVVSFPKNGLYAPKALNLLGVKYVIHRVSDGRASWTFPFWNYKDGTFSLMYNDGVYQIFKNNDVFQRAFLVYKYQVENNPQKILNKMFSQNFNLQKEIVLEQNPNLKLDSRSKGLAQIADYAPEKITINTSSEGNSLLFLSDSFYPGWEAYIDNNKTQIYRADYAFRAVYVPRGSHRVTFIYNPISFIVGVYAFIAGFLLIIIITVLKKLKLFSKT
jgi:hypothetical protein